MTWNRCTRDKFGNRQSKERRFDPGQVEKHNIALGMPRKPMALLCGHSCVFNSPTQKHDLVLVSPIAPAPEVSAIAYLVTMHPQPLSMPRIPPLRILDMFGRIDVISVTKINLEEQRASVSIDRPQLK